MKYGLPSDRAATIASSVRASASSTLPGASARRGGARARSRARARQRARCVPPPRHSGRDVPSYTWARASIRPDRPGSQARNESSFTPPRLARRRPPRRVAGETTPGRTGRTAAGVVVPPLVSHRQEFPCPPDRLEQLDRGPHDAAWAAMSAAAGGCCRVTTLTKAARRLESSTSSQSPHSCHDGPFHRSHRGQRRGRKPVGMVTITGRFERALGGELVLGELTDRLEERIPWSGPRASPRRSRATCGQAHRSAGGPPTRPAWPSTAVIEPTSNPPGKGRCAWRRSERSPSSSSS